MIEQKPNYWDLKKEKRAHRKDGKFAPKRESWVRLDGQARHVPLFLGTRKPEPETPEMDDRTMALIAVAIAVALSVCVNLILGPVACGIFVAFSAWVLREEFRDA